MALIARNWGTGERAKWTFVTKEDADKYIGENGGTAAEFEQVFQSGLWRHVCRNEDDPGTAKDAQDLEKPIKGTTPGEKDLFIYFFYIFVLFRHQPGMGRRPKWPQAFPQRQMPGLRDVRGQVPWFYCRNQI